MSLVAASRRKLLTGVTFRLAPEHLVKGFAQAFGLHELLVVQWAHVVVAVAATALEQNFHRLGCRIVSHLGDVRAAFSCIGPYHWENPP